MKIFKKILAENWRMALASVAVLAIGLWGLPLFDAWASEAVKAFAGWACCAVLVGALLYGALFADYYGELLSAAELQSRRRTGWMWG